ncbi:MAG: hypothetical protein PHV59_05615 [Victivallales bacterium]|nr:hypothetical protein [Victivallales bacterium]
MYETLTAILFCAEYNFEKLKMLWGEPKSPEQALLWRLKGGILKCVGTLLIAEKYFWIKQKTDSRYCPGDRMEKKPPKKLRKTLLDIIINSASGRTEREQIEKLKEGIRNVSTYLLNIKADKNYLNSKVLQNVYEYLQLLLEMEMSQISKTNKPG